MSDTSGNRVFNLSLNAREVIDLGDAISYAILDMETFITNHSMSMPKAADAFAKRRDAFRALLERVRGL